MKIVYGIIASIIIISLGYFILGSSDKNEVKKSDSEVINEEVQENISVKEACEIDAYVTSEYVEPYRSVTCLENINLSTPIFNSICNLSNTLQGDDMQVDATITNMKSCSSNYYGVCRTFMPDKKSSWNVYYYSENDVVFNPNTGDPYCDDWKYGPLSNK